MNNRRSLLAFLFVAAVISLAAVAPFLTRAGAQNAVAPSGSANGPASSASDPKIVYPESKKVEQFDDFFGTKVADPYRWLEDENSAETKA